MKLTIERAALLRSLAHVQNVVERRTTIPILSNVKLAADGDRLGLTATDMDLSLVAHEPAQVAEPRHHDRRRAHPVRHRPQAARRQRGRHRAERQAAARSRVRAAPLGVQPADACRPTSSRRSARSSWACRFNMAAGDLAQADRQDPVRDLDRGDALLPERHPRPRDQGRRHRHAARRRHRRPSPRPRRGGAAGRGRADPADHRAAQDRGRGAQADRRASAARSRSASRRPGSSSRSTVRCWSRA